MAANNHVEALCQSLEQLAEDKEEHSDSDLARILSGAVHLFASRSNDPYGEPARRQLQLPTSEACAVAAALLHSQSLTPFEFAMWFSSRQPNETMSDEIEENVADA